MSRWVYRKDEHGKVRSYEVGKDWIPENGQTVPVVSDRYMEGVRAVDGTDIGSRTKRRRYMQANNLADYDDFKGARERYEKQRAEHFDTKGPPSADLREAVARALYTHPRWKP